MDLIKLNSMRFVYSNYYYYNPDIKMMDYLCNPIDNNQEEIINYFKEWCKEYTLRKDIFKQDNKHLYNEDARVNETLKFNEPINPHYKEIDDLVEHYLSNNIDYDIYWFFKSTEFRYLNNKLIY